MDMRATPIRVLVVDDSALVRKVMSQMLASDPGIEVVGAGGLNQQVGEGFLTSINGGYFAQEQLWPHAARWDKEHHFPKDAHRGLAALGAYGICVPEAYGGANLDYLTLARAAGKSDVHNLEPEDLVALTIEAAAMARVPLAGTDWIPGRSKDGF